VTNIATQIALLQVQLSRNQAELVAAERSGAVGFVIDNLRQRIADQQAELARLQTELAQAQQREALGTASAGNLARDDQQATVQNSRSQAPNTEAQTLTPDGRIQTVPDTNTATTAIKPVTENSVDSGTNAPVRTLQQTQATPAYGPGLLLDPGDVEAQEGGYYGGGGPPTPPAATQIGAGAGSDDAGPRNPTRVEIDNVFTETKITPRPNVLDQYASYTYTASVYLMPRDQYEEMMRTKQRVLTGSQLLFQSGGAPVGGRNAFFSNDYYIDKFDIQSVIIGKGTGLTHNAKEINMTVIEPNGITLVDNLTRAVQAFFPATEKKKSITTVIYLLVIRFYGYNEQGILVRGGVPNPDGSSDPNAFVEKWFPFMIKDVKFKVANKLTEYEISAVAPQFMIGTGQGRATIPYNIELSGQTIKDLLAGEAQYTTTQIIAAETGDITETTVTNVAPAPHKANAANSPRTTIRQGLMAALNQHQRQLAAAGDIEYPDEFSIEFVGAGNAPSAIEQARLRPPGSLDKKSTSNAVPVTAADAKLPSKQSMDPNTRTQSATAGMQIVQFLDQVLRNSTYLKDQQLVTVDPTTNVEVYNGTPAQNVAWFKISLEATAKLDQWDSKRNQFAYKIKYIVSPYRIADLNSKFFPTPKFTGVQKEYKYWFTGENIAVLNYEENINGLYYLTLSGANFNLAGNYTDNATGEQIQYNFQTNSTESSQGAEGNVNEPVANAAEYLFQPGAVKEANVTIVGDPAWLQQGEGSFGQSTKNWNFGSFLPDGTINFDSGQILFRIAFNAPADYDYSTGIMRPGLASNSNLGPAQGAPTGPAQINRVYLAKTVHSQFVKGRFTQTLSGVLCLKESTEDNRAALQAQQALQQQAIIAMSSNRQFATATALAGSISTPVYTSPALNLNTFGQGVSVPGILNTNVLGSQATRPFQIPGVPTSLGLPVGTVNNLLPSPLRLSGASQTFTQTVTDAESGTQRTVRGVVDQVSNGTTQVMSGSDDAGDELTREVANAPVSEQTQYLDVEPATPNDLGEFFG
jgi:hypothetical protein